MATRLTPQLLRRIVLEEKAKIERETRMTKMTKMGKMKPVDEADKANEVDADGYAETVTHAKKHGPAGKHLSEMSTLNDIEADLRRKLRSLAEHKLALKKKIVESL